MTEDFEERKARAAAWFRSLRDEIVAAFEGLEDGQVEGPMADMPPGRFEVSDTKRASDDGSDAGGGLMSVMRGGRVFEKIGVNVSAVYGTLGERAQMAMAARKGIPGMKDDPRFRLNAETIRDTALAASALLYRSCSWLEESSHRLAGRYRSHVPSTI